MTEASGPGYHFFSGKGGVGKTTLAAATAVHLARAGHRVLITSTDPAHSLSDVFDASIGHQGVDLEPNLYALEVDSSERWAEATGAAMEEGRRPRGRMQTAMAEAMKTLGDAPGVDEFISLELLLETMTSDAYDRVVFDTAPTGHTLRLLLLPNMLDGWIGRMLTLRRHFARLGRAIRKLVARSSDGPEADFSENLQTARDRVAEARALISDPARTRFALVTIPEAMSVLETQRTMEQLANQGIPTSLIIANQVQPPSDACDHCRLRHEIHLREMLRLREVAGDVPVQEIASKAHVIRGPEALADLGRELWPPGA